MATLREFILAQSTLDTGNPVRDHIENPCECGGGGGTRVVLLDGLEIEMDDRCVEVQVDLGTDELEDDALELEVFVEDFDYDIEIC